MERYAGLERGEIRQEASIRREASILQTVMDVGSWIWQNPDWSVPMFTALIWAIGFRAKLGREGKGFISWLGEHARLLFRGMPRELLDLIKDGKGWKKIPHPDMGAPNPLTFDAIREMMEKIANKEMSAKKLPGWFPTVGENQDAEDARIKFFIPPRQAIDHAHWMTKKGGVPVSKAWLNYEEAAKSSSGWTDEGVVFAWRLWMASQMREHGERGLLVPPRDPSKLQFEEIVHQLRVYSKAMAKKYQKVAATEDDNGKK